MGKQGAYFVVGAGFSGAVLARELVERLDCTVIVVDGRRHAGGNCHTERDTTTGVMVHKYGPHIFNTDNERVWDYVNSHGVFRPFINRVKAVNTKGVFSLPINLHTINQFFCARFSPEEARQFIARQGDASIRDPANFEEQALKFLGKDLYRAFFYGYTKKQWGCEPRELPASILKRLPIRFNYDDNYYNKKWQGIPEQGYTAVIDSILDHPRIEVRLGESWQRSDCFGQFDHIFYTGPLDAYFNHSEGRLGYRTVTFERIDTSVEDYQGNAVINYTELEIPYTRIHEHKHFTPWEKHEQTVAFREYSKETEVGDIPYYPKRLDSDKALLHKYRNLALTSAKTSFLGRLATYRYMDMEKVIGEALEFADEFVLAMKSGGPHPVFPNEEE
jgi:UDP-galactopyranose mutase